jgi:hypothetical protein
MTPRFDSLFLILFLSLSVPCHAQHPYHRYRLAKNYRRSRRDTKDELFLGLPSYGPALNFQNNRLDNYLISRGGQPVKGFGAGDFYRVVGNLGEHFEFGGYFGYVIDHYFDSFRGGTYGVSVGWRVFQNNSFTNYLIGDAGVYSLDIYGLQPAAVTSRVEGDHLDLYATSCGLSSISYITLASWYSGTYSSSLNLGVQVGITWIASSTWRYGHEQDKGFNGVLVPEVPSLGSPYEYLRFSLAFKF